MKIDAYCHLLPAAYADRLAAKLGGNTVTANVRGRIATIPSLVDLDVRFGQMDEFGDYRQIVALPAPPIQDIGPPDVAREFARFGNECLADVCGRHPDRFAGWVACLPLNDIEGSLAEIDRACLEMGAAGVQVFTHVNGGPMDDPRFEPIWARMAELGRMIWVHPSRNATWADYPTEARSKYEIWWVFGWEYDTAAFMARMVFSGVLQRYPTIKFLIHHGGSLVPHFAGRVGPGWDQLGSRTPPDQLEDVETAITERPINYFHRFYADTALFGAEHAVRCSIEFFGIERILFASDTPFDPEKGPAYIRSTIANIESLKLTDGERDAIYYTNAERLLLGR